MHINSKADEVSAQFSFFLLSSERELTLTFDYVVVCPYVCRTVVCRLSDVCLSETFVNPTQVIEIFGFVTAPFGTLAILATRTELDVQFEVAPHGWGRWAWRRGQSARRSWLLHGGDRVKSSGC